MYIVIIVFNGLKRVHTSLGEGRRSVGWVSLKLLLPLVSAITQADCRHVRWNEQSRPPGRRAGAAVIKIINYARISGPQNGREIYAATISQIPRRTVDVNRYITGVQAASPKHYIRYYVPCWKYAYVYQHRREKRIISIKQK